MSLETQTQTGASSSARPYRRRRTRVGNDKKIQDDEFMAAAIGDVEWLRQSLRDQKLEQGQINYDKNGLTALHLSAIHGRLECLKLLIDKYKFDINLASSTGWRAIHLCISNQTGKRAIMCLQYLLDKKADSSIGNDDGITPLHQAASEGHVQCLKMLIDHGAKIDGDDCRGHTPLDLAKLWGHRKCARIIAAEMWQQGKDNIAKEMRQLRKLKMEQVLREMELEAEYKAQNEHYSEEAFKKWLSKQGLDKDMPTAPKHVKERKETDKHSHEALMKPNSITSKSTVSSKDKTKARHPDTIPAWKSQRPRDMSPLSRKTTNISQVTEDEDDGLHEKPEGQELESRDEKRAKSAGYINPNRWKIPLKVCDPPYITNLTDDYPRDEYTKMPLVESAPKYFDGWNGPRLYKKDVKESSVDTKDTKDTKKKSNVPKEIAKRIMSDDPTLDERPVLFKPRHIADVQVRKKYGEEVSGRSEVSLHLCDDMSSFLFKNSLSKGSDMFDIASGSKPLSKEHRKLLETNSILESHPNTRSTSSGNWSSVKFPREKVLQSLHIMTKPNAFPDIKGEEYSIGSGQMAV